MPKPTKSDIEQPAIELVSVIIIKDGHEHKGLPAAVGDTIQVDPETADWLREHHIIEG